MTGSLSWFGATRLRAGTLAGSSALFGVLTLAAASASIAQLVGHFGLSWSDGMFVVYLVTAGSVLLSVFYPLLIPVIGTIRLMLFFVGTGAVVGY